MFLSVRSSCPFTEWMNKPWQMAFCAGKRMPPSSVNSYLWPWKARRNSGMCFIRSRANSTCMFPMGSFLSVDDNAVADNLGGNGVARSGGGRSSSADDGQQLAQAVLFHENSGSLGVLGQVQLLVGGVGHRSISQAIGPAALGEPHHRIAGSLEAQHDGLDAQ